MSILQDNLLNFERRIDKFKCKFNYGLVISLDLRLLGQVQPYH